ncbi:hypothetical protein QFC22_005925 [Naganishia vaughanmartiniae]|uniref:Uncharacterized protein n=1 Tax=Naganishia vaughanmartiniae TaxID=1424756 RepID=A0ACC2WPR0_9TREE|nr:hypothetical protein QFC22_005925 [Naganishia vaughanmartiniae]
MSLDDSQKRRHAEHPTHRAFTASETSPGIDVNGEKATDGNSSIPVDPFSSPDDGRMAAKLDFASKGLTQVNFERAAEDEGQEARLHGTAMYSPVPGWPLGYGNLKPSGMADIEFPVKVHWHLLDNGFEWAERFLALWDVASEGFWVLSLHEEATPLPEYWKVHIQPHLNAAETRWRSIHGTRRREIPKVKPQLVHLPSSGRIVSCRESQVNSPGSRVQSPTQGDSTKSRASFSSNVQGSAVGVIDKKEVDQFDVSTLQQELQDVTHKLGDSDISGLAAAYTEDTPAQSRPVHQQTAAVGQDNVALAGGRSCQGTFSDKDEECQPSKHLQRRSSMEQEEADRLEVEKGPEYFSVYPRSFKSKSAVISDEQPVSLCLVRTSAIVPLSGYQDGKIVKKMAGDFDGDRVLASGPGAGSLAQAEALTDDTSEKYDISAAGALEGTFDEAAIRRHLRYIAPEAISDKKAIGSLVDVFSWGVAAYELVARRPIEDIDHSGVQDLLRDIHLHSIRPVTPIIGFLNTIPPELCDVIEKSVSLDPDERYSNLCAVLHDLHKIREICQGYLVGNARRQYQPGHIDYMSRFVVPPALVDREKEEDQLDRAYQKVKLSGSVETVCCWGPSGAGKSKLIEVWAKGKQASNAGQDCLVGWAKLDEHRVKPLSAFVSIFSSLLDRIFSDPLEDPEIWRKRIGNALSVNGNIFLSLIPPSYRSILLDHEPDAGEFDEPLGVDWEQYVKQFRSWSYGLLRLFASSSRPLVIVLDDYQWIGAEKSLWEDLLLHPMRHLDNALVLLSHRTLDGSPPDMAPFVDCQLIPVNSFSKDTLQSLVLRKRLIRPGVTRCFHFDHQPGNVRERITPQWTVLVNFLYDATQGNPLYNKMLLTALVRDGVVYFDFYLLKWVIRVEQLDRYTTTSVVAFVTSTLKSLSEGAREVLTVLACLPSRGVGVHLLSELVEKPAPIVRTLLDEAATLGSVQITRQQQAQFTHDKHHQAALSLIAPEDKPGLYISLVKKLENKGGDFIFSRADLIMEATALDPGCYPIPEKATIITQAAKRAARAAALGLAERYIKHTRRYADISAKELWQQNPRLALDLTTIRAELAMALRRSSEIIPEVRSFSQGFQISAYWLPSKIERARNQAQDMVAWIKIATLLFRLNLTANNIQQALENVGEAFSAIGIDLKAPTSTLPTGPEQVEAIIESIALQGSHEAISHKDDIAIAIAKLCLKAGATIYSYSTTHSKEYFDHAAQLILSSHVTRTHTAAAYTYTMQAISSANMLQVDLARSWLRLANQVKGDQGTANFSAVEAVVVTLDFINCRSVGDMEYQGAYEACIADNNMDTLVYAGGLDLAGSFLAGRDLRYTLTTGEKVLGWLQYDFQSASKVMIASSIQLAANCSDSDRDFHELQVLEGKYLARADSIDLSNLPPLFAIVYWTNSLAGGIFFHAPEEELRSRAAQVYKHLDGGAGTVMMFYSGFLLSWFSIMNDSTIDFEILQSTKRKLSAFKHNHDFRNMIKCLDALLGLRRMMDGDSSLDESVDGLEDAIECLDASDHHLLRGTMAFAGAVCLSAHMPQRKRLTQGYAMHARLAYGKCNGFGLVRYVDKRFPEVAATVTAEGLRANAPSNFPYGQSPQLASAAFPTVSGGGLRPEPLSESDALSKDAMKEGMLERKLNLESVLRSFLVLASEKSSEMLIQKVLRILMQINRSDWSCLALQDPSTNSLHLRGAGSYDSLKIYDIPISKASALCPTTILLRGSVSHQTINTSHSTSSAIKNLFEREPFFRKRQPKHLLMTPLFVQGRFSGSLVLTGQTANSSNTQVSLLATFAAIALEAHSAFASLEVAVETRTAALEQALAHKQTFISSISHELRTPLYSISGLCAVMQSASDLTPAQNENLGVIASSAEDLQRIVTAILDMAKLESGGMTAEAIPFDLRDTLESSLESVAHISRAKGIELVLENDVSTDPPGRLIGDPHRVRQCLLNLLSNAVKFSRTGSDPAFIKLGWTVTQEDEETDAITVTVTDNGIGIPKSKMNKLFHSFSQIDASITRQYGGTGLGLSITRGLARLLGQGDCWAESAEGQGSTFYLMFKVPREKTAPTPRKEPKFQPGAARKAIVFAPDIETTAVLMRNLQQFNVETSRDSRLQLDELLEPSPHFVIIDIDKVDEFKDRLGSFAKQGEFSKLVYLVALTEVSSAMDTLGLTHDSIVTKPIKCRALYDVTKHLIETKKRMPKKTGNTGSGLDKAYGKKYPLKILYVDDSSVNVMVGRKLLSRFGYNDIDVCYDGLQAVAAAEKTAYDLIIMDLQMPIADGYTATSMIQSAFREKTASSSSSGDDGRMMKMPTIVALTANADENTRNRCISSGFSGFLSKPLVISTLAETLRTTYEARYTEDGGGGDQHGE